MLVTYEWNSIFGLKPIQVHISTSIEYKGEDLSICQGIKISKRVFPRLQRGKSMSEISHISPNWVNYACLCQVNSRVLFLNFQVRF